MLQESVLHGQVPASVMEQIGMNFENLFRPDVQQQLTAEAKAILQQAAGTCVIDVFWLSLSAALICLIVGLYLPPDEKA